jgi:hypothetical protein
MSAKGGFMMLTIRWELSPTGLREPFLLYHITGKAGNGSKGIEASGSQRP